MEKIEFIQFLKDNNIDLQFKNNFKQFSAYKDIGALIDYLNAVSKANKKCYLNTLINRSFAWSHTPEGVDFWRDIEYKFISRFNLNSID